MAATTRQRSSRRTTADFRIYDEFRALPVSERSIVLRHLQYFMQDDVKPQANSGDADGSAAQEEQAAG